MGYRHEAGMVWGREGPWCGGPMTKNSRQVSIGSHERRRGRRVSCLCRLDLSQMSVRELLEGCSPAVTPRASRGRAIMVSFQGAHVPQAMILACGRWSGAYPVSSRQGEALLP